MVTASTAFQNDAEVIRVTLEALADEPVTVIATTAHMTPPTLMFQRTPE